MTKLETVQKELNELRSYKKTLKNLDELRGYKKILAELREQKTDVLVNDKQKEKK